MNWWCHCVWLIVCFICVLIWMVFWVIDCMIKQLKGSLQMFNLFAFSLLLSFIVVGGQWNSSLSTTEFLIFGCRVVNLFLVLAYKLLSYCLCSHFNYSIIFSIQKIISNKQIPITVFFVLSVLYFFGKKGNLSFLEVLFNLKLSSTSHNNYCSTSCWVDE